MVPLLLLLGLWEAPSSPETEMGKTHRPPRGMTCPGRLPSLPPGVRPHAGIQCCLKEDQGTFRSVVTGPFLEKKAHPVTDSPHQADPC